jgi:lipopolysaccharide transport system permease protein
VGRGILIITQAWFFLTPVIYPLPVDTFASGLVRLNPVSPILVSTRDWMTGGMGGLELQFALVSLITLVMLVISWMLLRLAMPHLLSRISA